MANIGDWLAGMVENNDMAQSVFIASRENFALSVDAKRVLAEDKSDIPQPQYDALASDWYKRAASQGGFVFTPVRNKPAELWLKTLNFLTDVKEIRLNYKDGQSVVFPATVEIKSYDVGTFVSLNLSLKTVRAVSDLFATESDPDKITFVRSDGTEREMSLAELNQALSNAFDSAVDIAARTGKAIIVFLKNLSRGIWIYAEETSASVGKALAEAGRWISESASSVSQSVNKLKDKAGEALGNTMGNIRDHLESAAETVKDIWNGLRGLLIFTMLRLKLR